MIHSSSNRVKEGVNKVIDLVTDSVSELSTPISGGIYPFSRPFNSKLEDIVVGALPLVRGAIPEMYLNINIYVPNKRMKINNTVIDDMPNMQRLDEIGEKIISDLFDKSVNSYYITVESQRIMKDATEGYYVHNIQIGLTYV